MSSRDLETLFGEQTLAALLDDNRHPARGLPGQAYTNQTFFEIEYERLFAPSWIYVGHVHDIPGVGDIMPIDLFARPIILVRDSSDQVRVFHNVCRHRGTRLVRSPTEALRPIVCPYHAWTYGLDGALRSSPHFGGYQAPHPPGFDPRDMGLREIDAQVFGDWLFVNPDGQAGPLELHLKPLLEELDFVDFSQVRHFFSLDFGEVDANWKLMLENSLENYHIPHVHGETAGGHRLEDHFSIIREYCIGTGIDPEESDTGSRTGGPERLDMSARYLALLPNFFVVTCAADILITHFRLPVSPVCTRFQVHAYTTSGQIPDKKAIDDWRQFALAVQQEDIFIQTEQQATRHSPATRDGGVLSPAWEQSVRAFHRYLLGKLQ